MPSEAIVPDTEPGVEDWLEINTKFAAVWPNITTKGEQLADAEEWDGKPNKKELLSEKPGVGD